MSQSELEVWKEVEWDIKKILKIIWKEWNTLDLTRDIAWHKMIENYSYIQPQIVGTWTVVMQNFSCLWERKKHEELERIKIYIFTLSIKKIYKKSLCPEEIASVYTCTRWADIIRINGWTYTTQRKKNKRLKTIKVNQLMLFHPIKSSSTK